MKYLFNLLEEVSGVLLTVVSMLLAAAVESDLAFTVILVIIVLIWLP